MKNFLGWILSVVLRPLCWVGWHPIRSTTDVEKFGVRKRCDICGRFI